MLFEQVARVRKGTALCTARATPLLGLPREIRPSVFQQVRANDTIVQCDSCPRILYYIPNRPVAAPSCTVVSQLSAYRARRRGPLWQIDGGSRGNPGPAGYGVRIAKDDGTVIE